MAAKPYLYPVRHPKGKVPDILSAKYKTGESIVQGSLLARDSAGELILHTGTTAINVVGVALEKAASKPGWDAANSPTVVTGRVQEDSFAQADIDTVYSIRQEDGSGNLVAPVQTHIGEQYGVLNVSGEWRLDRSETTTKIFRIVDIDIANGLTFVKFLATAIELTAV
jgi:hypothetical protein